MKAFVFPGQGSQKKGMGEPLFDLYRDYEVIADRVLGYSIRDLCLQNPDNLLLQTQYTQPALYVVNALSYLHKVTESAAPDFVAGHSLGEYNALFAAGVVDFELGLRLVQRRGALMSQAKDGAMAAVVGLQKAQVLEILAANHISSIQIANENSPSQLVLSGDKLAISQSAPLFTDAGARYLPLNVSAAFHSSFMRPAELAFADFIQSFQFNAPVIPVIANINARPYRTAEIRQNLTRQISGAVKWNDTIRYILGVEQSTGQMIDIEEVGPGRVLANLTQKIRREASPLSINLQADMAGNEAEFLPGVETRVVQSSPAVPQATASVTPQPAIVADNLGSETFKQEYGLKFAYMAGAMYRGIGSKEIVIQMARAGMMGFLGTGGLSQQEIEDNIIHIQQALSTGQPYGMNLLHNMDSADLELATVGLYMRYGVSVIEAAAYMPTLSKALVLYRLKGCEASGDGGVLCHHRIVAKVSRPEVAQAFMSPAPSRFVEQLLADQLITQQEAAWAEQVPMADDICVEADSGGHTDMGVAYALLPAIQVLRDQCMQQFPGRTPIRIGAAGGIGTPEAAAAAFILGADFIVTGSINQCTVEANTSEAVKDLLQQMNVQDTEYAPAGDMFELGAKVQVLKKGLFFPARANKLYDLYQRYGSLDEIDEKTATQLQQKYFQRSFDDIYRELKQRYGSRSPQQFAKAEKLPKQKMALVFRWYFSHTTKLALRGEPQQKVNFQVHTGPALGAFNQWVKGSSIESWRQRHVDDIALKLMASTAELLDQRMKSMLIPEFK